MFVSPADDRSWRSGSWPLRGCLRARATRRAGSSGTRPCSWTRRSAQRARRTPRTPSPTGGSATPSSPIGPSSRAPIGRCSGSTLRAEGCERVGQLDAEPGFPLLSTWTWTPLGSTQPTRYDVTVDADGVWLRTPSCFRHPAPGRGDAPRRLPDRWIDRVREPRRVRGPAQDHAPVRAPLPGPRGARASGASAAHSLAAHGARLASSATASGSAGRPRSSSHPAGMSSPATPRRRRSKGLAPRGQGVRRLRAAWTHTPSAGRRGAIERRPNGEIAIQFEVVHPTLAACKKAKP